MSLASKIRCAVGFLAAVVTGQASTRGRRVITAAGSVLSGIECERTLSSVVANMRAGNRGTKRKVLFVDDERQWRESALVTFARAGFDIFVAADGSEAMAKGTDPALDLIIVDEDLAGESGLVLMNFLRRNNPDVPTLLYASAESAADDGGETKPIEADDCVPKGNMDELIAQVRSHLG